MKNYGIFDVLGPVMIGPSSSHTAGAEKLGRAARSIAEENIKSVVFYLHGSFAKTYRGHGTDRALVAGILGMEPDDERIKDSFKIAKDAGIDVQFVESDLGDAHPNTVRIEITKTDGTLVNVTGSSIGGGNIVVTNINGDSVEFSGEYPVILVKHFDKRGMISKITFALALGNINIATLKVGRTMKGDIATTVIETDNKVSKDVVKELHALDGVLNVKAINLV